MKSVRITFAVTPEVAAMIRRCAAYERRSTANYVDAAVIQRMRQQGRQQAVLTPDEIEYLKGTETP